MNFILEEMKKLNAGWFMQYLYSKKNKNKDYKAINKGETWVNYNDYESYNFLFDENKNITMITTGCPSDNEYCGETYSIIYIKENYVFNKRRYKKHNRINNTTNIY